MVCSVFSVEYEHPDHPDNYCSVDWLGKKNGWVFMWKSKTGSKWYPDMSPALEVATAAIVKKFGLETLIRRLPLEKLLSMSPAGLVRYRQKRGLPRIEVFSDTPGDRQARTEDYE